MFRLFSVILIIVISTLIGIYKGNEIKERKNVLLEFKALIINLEKEINYFKSPLPDIFKKLYLITDENNKAFVSQFINEDINDFKTKWENAVENVFIPLHLKDSEINVLKKPGVFLGQSDYFSQKSHFDFFYDEIDKIIVDAEHEFKSKGQMYSKMGISIGIIIAIIIM